MKKVIQSVKGTRDFYPEQMAIRVWLYDTMRSVSESFGYQEWEAPLIEPLELYAAKSGEELVKQQSYVFKDRGGSEITLRPELTPSLVRMIAQKQNELVFPVRWWSFGPFWRYERPQKGRTREFFQWNVDMLGVDSPEADAENVAVLATFFQRVGLSPEQVVILVNNRRLTDSRFDAFGTCQAAAKAANWQARPSPSSELGTRTATGTGTGTRSVASGRGIACVLYEGDNGYCAMVANVDVHLDTGVVDVSRLVMALDSGPISNPDGLRNQAEGGALHGMSRALFEEVTWDDEKVTSVDWRTYRTFPVGFKIPRLETVLINSLEAEACGAGETSITVTAAAIGNAIFDATGMRLRQVPFSPERIKQAGVDARR